MDSPSVYQSLKTYFSTREGAGVLMMTVGSGVSLGLVPNIAEAAWDSLWLYVPLCFLMILLVLRGWTLLHSRGIGVLFVLYPDPDQARLDDMQEESKKNHDSTLVLGKELFALNDGPLTLSSRAELAAKLINARVAENKQQGGNGTVSLYPLAPIQDGYSLGRHLTRHAYPTLTVMHRCNSPQRKNEIISGVTLDSRLKSAPSAVQLDRLAGLLTVPPTEPLTIVDHDGCPPEHGGRLALIIRITPSAQMVEHAIHVAKTGEVRVPEESRPHTGYLFDEQDKEAVGTPCGGYVVVETPATALSGDGLFYLPERQEVFESMVAHLFTRCTEAITTWKTRTGLSQPAVQLFINAPVAVAIGLGWALQEYRVRVVHHVMDYVGEAMPTQ